MSEAKTFVRALRASELSPGEKKAVVVDEESVLVCNSNGQLFAVSNVCSHAAGTLESGRMSRGWISCPLHGARFELATGRALNAPAKRPIATYEVRVVDDWIEVAV